MPETNHRTSSLADAPVRSESARQSFSLDEAGRLATMFSPIARGVRSMRRRLRRVRDHRWTVTAVTVVVSAFLVFHFSLTGLYLLPLNPVKLAFGRYLSAYVDPLFTQNWHLFAPDPVNSSFSVIGKCRTGDAESAWLDVTHGTVERLKSNPVPGPLSSALHLQTTLIRAYLLGSSDVEDHMLRGFCRDQPEAEYCSRRGEQTTAVIEIARSALVRLLTDVCVTSGFTDVDSVYIRLANLKFPRFSSRSLPDEAGEVLYVDVGWQLSALNLNKEAR